MSSRIGDRMIATRRHRFVGRERERALFQNALDATHLPFQIVHVFGPGGIGKTTLLKEFAALAEQKNLPTYYLDACNLEPSPQSLLDALRAAMGLDGPTSPTQVLANQSTRHILLIDTLEILAPWDNWLCENFLSQLPEDTLLVLASRDAPSAAWCTDLGEMLHLIALRNLSPEESCDYLARRNIPSAEHAAVLDFTHGHPLALSLVADVFAQRPNFHFQPEQAPDVIKTLLEQFANKVPSPAHRAALEACVLLRLTTESLLAEMLGVTDAHELFEWLRGLSFIQSGAHGIFPHDLAREALTADLRWRNPDWHKELHKRARAYYVKHFERTNADAQQRVLSDFIFLHRDNAVVRTLFQWDNLTAITDTMRESDRAALIEMVARHEGASAAGLAAHWLARQPEGVQVYREPDQSLAGFLMAIALERATEDDWQRDPGARAAARHLCEHAPLRPGERAILFRFWMARDTYQTVSPIQSLIFVNIVRYSLTTAGLAYTFIPCAEPEHWGAGFAYGDLTRLPEADFEIGGRQYGVYGRDWRASPPMTWLALMAERETGGASDIAPSPSPPLVILNRDEFASAVRAALHHLPHAESLHDNPLIHSRVVVQHSDAHAPIAARAVALQNLLTQTIASLQASPRMAKLFRVLEHTYVQPAPTQEQAAELLDLPFSTYRRHLKEGIAHVVEILWREEIGK
ncbi:MAG: AAA family ATPase [Chloroflexota bacterium]